MQSIAEIKDLIKKAQDKGNCAITIEVKWLEQLLSNLERQERETYALQREFIDLESEMEQGCDCDDIGGFNTNDLINEIRRRNELYHPLGLLETDRIIGIITKSN